MNHSRTKRTPRSSTVRRTYSSWRSMRAVYGACRVGFRRPARPGNRAFTFGQRPGNRGPESCGHTTGHRTQCVGLIDAQLEEHAWSTRRSTSGSTAPSRPPGCGRRRRSSPTARDLPIWGFDGSSTNQAPGSNSDCVLKPVFSCPDPIRGGDNMLVMCEVLLTDMTPHPTNTRALLAPIAEKYASARAAVRHRAGVHVLQGRPPARLPGAAASRRRRASTTAASAPTRCSAVTSSRRTSTRASRPASASPASTPK